MYNIPEIAHKRPMDIDVTDKFVRLGDVSTAAMGHRMRIAREALGMTQTQLADGIGISVQGLNNMERGRNKPNMQAMRHLHRIHNVDFNYILHGDYDRLPGLVRQRIIEAASKNSD